MYRIVGFLKIQNSTIMLYDCKMALMLIMQCTLERKVEGKEWGGEGSVEVVGLAESIDTYQWQHLKL